MVASPHEIEAIRAACGPDFLIVTPGVRPAGGELGDQKRVMTPAEAVARGADYLVIGRPIIKAEDPRAAARAIAGDIGNAAENENGVEHRTSDIEKNGADEGTRTLDLSFTKALLYQLSYVGPELVVPRARLELATRGFSVHCSTN